MLDKQHGILSQPRLLALVLDARMELLQIKENVETHKTNDIDDLLVKSNILHGKLSESVKLAEDPKSDLGKGISKLEKKEIMEAIKNLENKILKIKLTVDQK